MVIGGVLRCGSRGEGSIITIVASVRIYMGHKRVCYCDLFSFGYREIYLRDLLKPATTRAAN